MIERNVSMQMRFSYPGFGAKLSKLSYLIDDRFIELERKYANPWHIQDTYIKNKQKAM
jgi:hypothetical protein